MQLQLDQLAANAPPTFPVPIIAMFMRFVCETYPVKTPNRYAVKMTQGMIAYTKKSCMDKKYKLLPLMQK